MYHHAPKQRGSSKRRGVTLIAISILLASLGVYSVIGALGQTGSSPHSILAKGESSCLKCHYDVYDEMVSTNHGRYLVRDLKSIKNDQPDAAACLVCHGKRDRWGSFGMADWAVWSQNSSVPVNQTQWVSLGYKQVPFPYGQGYGGAWDNSSATTSSTLSIDLYSATTGASILANITFFDYAADNNNRLMILSEGPSGNYTAVGYGWFPSEGGHYTASIAGIYPDYFRIQMSSNIPLTAVSLVISSDGVDYEVSAASKKIVTITTTSVTLAPLVKNQSSGVWTWDRYVDEWNFHTGNYSKIAKMSEVWDNVRTIATNSFPISGVPIEYLGTVGEKSSCSSTKGLCHSTLQMINLTSQGELPETKASNGSLPYYMHTMTLSADSSKTCGICHAPMFADGPTTHYTGECYTCHNFHNIKVLASASAMRAPITANASASTTTTTPITRNSMKTTTPITANVSSSASVFRFAVYGDTRGNSGTTPVNTAVLSSVSNAAAGSNPAFALFTGDMCYDITQGSCVSVWKSAANSVLAGKTVAIQGNHDTSSATTWDSAWNMPVIISGFGGSRYSSSVSSDFSFDYGNSHFVGMQVVDDVSSSRPSSAQLTWLDSDLSLAESSGCGGSGCTLTFIFWHAPVYCVSPDSGHCSPPPVPPAQWTTVTNAHRSVAAIFQGHEHIMAYAHISASRIAGVSTSNEYEEFITGGGGAPLVGCGTRGDFCSSNYGYAVVDVSGSTVTVQYLDQFGVAMRSPWTFSKSGVQQISLTASSIYVGSHSISQASGMSASRRYSNIYWMIDDHGSQSLYAVSGTGVTQHTFTVSGASKSDWTGVAVDENGYIWIADAGDNTLSRSSYVLYRISEPDPYGSATSVSVTAFRFTYPDGSHDSEGMFVWQGTPYIIKKSTFGTDVYAFPYLDSSQTVKLNYIATFKGGLMITDASISRDGRRLALINDQDYHWIIERSASSTSVADFFNAPTRQWSIYFPDQTGEAISFLSDGSYGFMVASNEGSLWKVTPAQYGG